MTHDKVKIKTDAGMLVDAVAPLVISASRATDLPAFHSEWFMDKLRKGWCAWRNPFNGVKSYVSFSKCRLIVFWSKNPEPMFKHIGELDSLGVKYYFQYSTNDYEKEGVEPDVPAIEERIDTFLRLSEKVGREKVIWRYDPVLKADGLPLEETLERIRRIGEVVSPHTMKLVFSFIDIENYATVKRNLARLGPAGVAEPTHEERLGFAEKLAAVNLKWPHPLRLATCAETEGLEAFGIEPNKCIDGGLISWICNGDPDIAKVYGAPVPPSEPKPKRVQLDLFGNPVPRKKAPSAGVRALGRNAGKDSGQRVACGCALSKDIGSYGTCMHICAYCYANHNPASIEHNYRRCFPESDSLLP